MPKAINKTISLTSEHITILEDLCVKSHFNSSMLLRGFIKYFKANPEEFKKIGDYLDWRNMSDP